MAMFDGSLSITGLDTLAAGMKKATAESRAIAMQGLEKGAANIVADAQDNLRKNSSVVTGLLRQSAKVQRMDGVTIDAGFFDTRNKQGGYAWFVEYGRRAGRMPPPDEIVQWARKKFSLDPKAARAMGWAMAVKIARRGTRPHPFFAPAIEKNRRELIRVMQEALSIGL